LAISPDAASLESVVLAVARCRPVAAAISPRGATRTVRFALARGERRQRAAEPVDLAEQLVEEGLDVAAYLIEAAGDTHGRAAG
jgi:hypothetical protein